MSQSIERSLPTREVVLAVAKSCGLADQVLLEVEDSLQLLDTFGVGCSGGADSVATLLWLWARYPEKRIVVLHFDHGVRGEDSAVDREYVKQLGHAMGLDTFVGVSEAPLIKANEALLREKRFAFFAKTLGSQGGQALVAGHHAGDVAETLLIRLLRGVGADGLSAPRPDSVGLNSLRVLRPFLETPKAVLIEFLTRLGVRWREDKTNGEDRYLRNALRNTVLPALEATANAFGRDASGMLLKARRSLQADSEIVAWATQQSIDRAEEGAEILSAAVLRDFPDALFMRVLGEWARNTQKIEVSETVLRNALKALRVGQESVFSVSSTHQLRLGKRIEWIVSDSSDSDLFAPIRLPVGPEVFLPDRSILQAEILDLDEQALERVLRGEGIDPAYEAFLSFQEENTFPLTLRTRQPGDKIQILGAPGSKKLKDLLNQRRIGLSERNKLPIVCDHNGSILWVPGLPPSEQARLQPGVNRALRLTYRFL